MSTIGQSRKCGSLVTVLKLVPSDNMLKRGYFFAYHNVSECVASGAIHFHYEPGKKNLADLLTKFLPTPAYKECCKQIMF